MNDERSRKPSVLAELRHVLMELGKIRRLQHLHSSIKNQIHTCKLRTNQHLFKMAKVFSYSPIYALLFVFLILFASSEMGMAEEEPRLCEKRCQRCRGECRKPEVCNELCMLEGAVSGACVGSVCYCYFKC